MSQLVQLEPVGNCLGEPPAPRFGEPTCSRESWRLAPPTQLPARLRRKGGQMASSRTSWWSSAKTVRLVGNCRCRSLVPSLPTNDNLWAVNGGDGDEVMCDADLVTYDFTHSSPPRQVGTALTSRSIRPDRRQSITTDNSRVLENEKRPEDVSSGRKMCRSDEAEITACRERKRRSRSRCLFRSGRTSCDAPCP